MGLAARFEFLAPFGASGLYTIFHHVAAIWLGLNKSEHCEDRSDCLDWRQICLSRARDLQISMFTILASSVSSLQQNLYLTLQSLTTQHLNTQLPSRTTHERPKRSTCLPPVRFALLSATLARLP